MIRLEKNISYFFKDKSLLEQALTHPSIEGVQNNYEKLEFLGDSVLNLAITHYIYKNFSAKTEGELAKLRSYLVSGKVIAQIAKNNEIGQSLILSSSEESNNGRNRSNNLENALEAILGAIYLDSGLEKAFAIIYELWNEFLKNTDSIPRNPKVELQEWSQANNLGIPIYQLKNKTGPDHAPFFEINVSVGEGMNICANGVSKKDAENNAAKKLLDNIKKGDFNFENKI